MKKEMISIAIVAMLATLVLAMPAAAQEVYLVPQNSSASFCNTVDVEIWVNATNLVGGQINMTYDSTCANVTNWELNTEYFPSMLSWWEHYEGSEWIGFVSGTGPLTGEYLIGTLTIHCVCEDECSTTLDFVNPSKLVDEGGNKIEGVTWIDGTFECVTGICGDVAPYPNTDGEVDIGDVVRLLSHVGNPGEYPVDSWAGDCKCGDGIDIGDVVLLLSHVGNPGEYPLECC